MSFPSGLSAEGLVVVAVVVAAGVAFAVLGAIVRRRRRVLAAAFEPGSARLRIFSVEGRWQGYTFRASVRERSHVSPGSLELVVPVVATLSWRAVAVGRSPGFAEIVTLGLIEAGVLLDAEVGDPFLDRVLRFGTRDLLGFSVVFGSEAVREAMRDLVALPNFRSIVVRRKRVSVQFERRVGGLDDDPVVLRTRMTAVVRLLSALGCSPTLGES